MNGRVRASAAVIAGLVLGGFFIAGLEKLPSVGLHRRSYGTYVNERSVADRHVTNAVAEVTFDMRGFDTLLEESIFFAAVMSVRLLLRPTPRELETNPTDHAPDRHPLPSSEAIRAGAGWLLPLALLIGLYIVVHGHLTPGGGFQAGAMVGSAGALLYLADRYDAFRRVAAPEVLDPPKSIATAGFALLGLLGLFFGNAYLQNVMPKGYVGQIDSGGFLPLFNFLVGVEVAAGTAVILYEFLGQVLRVRPKDSP